MQHSSSIIFCILGRYRIGVFTFTPSFTESQLSSNSSSTRAQTHHIPPSFDRVCLHSSTDYGVPNAPRVPAHADWHAAELFTASTPSSRPSWPLPAPHASHSSSGPGCDKRRNDFGLRRRWSQHWDQKRIFRWLWTIVSDDPDWQR